MRYSRTPSIIGTYNQFECFQTLGADKYMAPPISMETGMPIMDIASWRELDKKSRKALTKEQEQLRESRQKYLKDVRREEKTTSGILGKQLSQTQKKTAMDVIQSGAAESPFGGNLMSLLPLAGIGLVLLLVMRRK